MPTELDIQAIAHTIPELPEENSDPKAEIVELEAVGGSVMLRGIISSKPHGRYPLRRASKILKEIKKQGGSDFYLDCW